MDAVVLAGGKGIRMRDIGYKVLIDIDGVPMIKRIADSVVDKNISKTIIVVGDLKDKITEVLKKNNVIYAYQPAPLGTMDALSYALPIVSSSCILVLPGDMPYIEKNIIDSIIKVYRTNHCKNLIVEMLISNPTGYGRIIEEHGTKKIVEESFCDETQLINNLINTGIYILNVNDIRSYLISFGAEKPIGFNSLTNFINDLYMNKKIYSLYYDENYKIMTVNDKEALERVIKLKEINNLEGGQCYGIL